ncbi:fibroleukin-like [Hydractinia symbiolongicarpus]|uniref:fibroleukin-like n=1 Tax=Hydractinia symbiolongicarpus TaxID=13093 RepID=UPI00254F9328|nr:fibroleukin-like [Hydractinia symbiolongicarpus]
MSMFFCISFTFLIKASLGNYLSCSRDDIEIHEVARNKRLNAAPYLTKTVRNENECLVVCLYNDYCLSYNVNMTSQNVKCELFSKLDGEEVLIQQVGFKYFKVQTNHRCIPVDNSSLQICDCRSVTYSKRDCLEWREKGAKEDGLYNIKVGDQTVEVFCDMTTDGGGWTVIQKRQRSTNPVNFNTTWDKYKKGFGDLKTEFWLGNDYIHKLSAMAETTLRIHSTAKDNMKKISILKYFKVANEGVHYQVSYRFGTGPSLFDARYTRFNQSKFSTIDSDNDIWQHVNCAVRLSAGFWFDACSVANLNGPFIPHDQRFGFMWRGWNAPDDTKTYQLETTMMMLRRGVN